MSLNTILSNIVYNIDSKNNTGYTTRDDGGLTRIVSMPVTDGSATEFSQSNQLRQALLVNNGTNDVIRFEGGQDYSAPKQLSVTPTSVFTFSFKITHSYSDFIFSDGVGNGNMIEIGDFDNTPLIKIRGSNLSAPKTWAASGFNYVTFRVDCENQLADLIFNGVETNNIAVTGTADRTETEDWFGSRDGQGSFVGDAEYLIASQEFVTLEKLRDLDSYIRGTYIPVEKVGPITKDGVLQQGVKVQVTAYDDYTMATGKQDVGTYETNIDGIAEIPLADIPAGKKLFIVPHLNDTGVTSSDQGKFVSNTF